MSALITLGESSTEPIAVVDYETTQESGNLVHEILGSDEVDITFRPASKRRGMLRLVYDTAEAAAAGAALHTLSGILSLTYPEQPTVEMSYVVAERGQIRRRRQAAGEWTVDVDYREVTP